jgi:uncharacterized protein (DUF433 family)
MTCRDEILDCVKRIIEQTGENKFTPQEVLEYMQARGTEYAEGTIRTHVISRMCANAPKHHAVTYDDFERIGHGIYKLKAYMEITLNQHIEITPGVRGGQPRLAGSRITVADVVLMHLRLGQSLPEIAGKYNLPLATVYAAMAYYYDHRAEIDQRIEADVAFAEAFRRNNPSPLQEKLKALSSG